ncbi:MAG: hypothetical protein ACYC56_01975 [Candidatus Aquicultor sp.]
MNPEERKEIINIFNEGFEQVVLPYIARIQEDIAGMHLEISEIKDVLEDHSLRFDRIERKLNAVVARQDEQGIEIKQLKDRLA